jgi:hypothetical protein
MNLGANAAAAKTLLADADADPVAVYMLLVAVVGWEAVHGEDAEDTIELYRRLEEKFSVRVHDDNESKIQAMINLVENDAFFESRSAFRATCNTLSIGDPGLRDDGVDDVEWPEMLWAMFVAAIVREDNETADFSDAVKDEMLLSLKRETEEQDPLMKAKAFMELQKQKMILDLTAIGVPRVEVEQMLAKAEASIRQ